MKRVIIESCNQCSNFVAGECISLERNISFREVEENIFLWEIPEDCPLDEYEEKCDE